MSNHAKFTAADSSPPANYATPGCRVLVHEDNDHTAEFLMGQHTDKGYFAERRGAPNRWPGSEEIRPTAMDIPNSVKFECWCKPFFVLGVKAPL